MSPGTIRKGLVIGALGVVYGDIGTSPLYAFRDCFQGIHAVPPSPENILGLLSLFFWALTLVVVLKYLTVLMRADNHGEGGILALIALLSQRLLQQGKKSRWSTILLLLGLFGTALLYGDGVITPSISVLSAVEGLAIAKPVFQSWVVPITLVVLGVLFMVQKHGTAKVGSVFGRCMVLWFLAIGVAAVPWLVKEPKVLLSLDPRHAIDFFMRNGLHGFLVLGSVVLCVTGAEALYADLGHFGASPIRKAWYRIAYPALVLNYLGQGALLIHNQGVVIENPFFSLFPRPLLIPIVLLATMATVIASQALISGAFSLSHQATQLGFLPRLKLIHTSEDEEGQIYIPSVNHLLMFSCFALVLAFKESIRLAGAYGIAVTGTMGITSLLFAQVAREVWKWPAWKAWGLAGAFLVVDLSLLGANLFKIPDGGWVPLTIACLIFFLMTTWRRGRRILSKEIFNKSMLLEKFLEMVRLRKPLRVNGTAVFMVPNVTIASAVLLHHLEHNQVLHERVLLVTVQVRHVPSLPLYEHGRVTDLGDGIYQVIAQYGYMQQPNVFEILSCAKLGELAGDEMHLSFYIGRETLLPTGRSRMRKWRKNLFIYLSRNSRPATAFFGIPPERVVEIGLQLEL